MKLVAVIIEDCDKCKTITDFAFFFARKNDWDFEAYLSKDIEREESILRSYIVAYHLDEEGMFVAPLYLLYNDEGEIVYSAQPDNTGEFYRAFFPHTRK